MEYINTAFSLEQCVPERTPKFYDIMCRKNHKNRGVNQCPNRQKGTSTNYDKLKQKYEFSPSSTKKKAA